MTSRLPAGGRQRLRSKPRDRGIQESARLARQRDSRLVIGERAISLVSTPSIPPRPAPIGAIALLVLACPFYAVMLAAILGGPGGDPASYGGEGRMAAAFAELYALASGCTVWIVMGLLLWIGGTRGEMPRWAAISAGILYPLAGIAAGIAIDMSYDYPGGWLILVPAVLAPVVAFYAMWARLPRIHTVLPADITSGFALGAIVVLTIAPFPLSELDRLGAPARAARYQERMEALVAKHEADWAKVKEEHETAFRQLTPDSSLRDYLDDLYFPYPYDAGVARHEEALAGARRVKSRQGDAVMLLKEGRMVRLEDLWRLDLEATPSLCEAYGEALRQAATTERPGADGNIALELERQLPNMKWLVAEHCNLDDALVAVEAKVQRSVAGMGQAPGDLPRWTQFLAAVAALHPPR